MKYESKQHTASASASTVYERFSNFENLNPYIGDKVEDWQATKDRCSFKAQGMTLKLRMETPSEVLDSSGKDYVIKVVGEDTPVAISMWLQLKEVAQDTTKLRVVAEVELNMMLKMMVGSKLKDGVEAMAQRIAQSF